MELDTSSVNGNGGSITLSATTENVQNSTAHLTLKSTGNIGGDITATSAQAAVNLNKTDITADTLNGNLPTSEGGRVSINAAKTATLSGPIQSNSNHKGGSIEITGSNIAVGNDPPNNPPLLLRATGADAGGSIKLTATTGNLDLKKFVAEIQPTDQNADGGHFEANAAQGVLLFTDNDISVDGQGSGNGGTIKLAGKSFQVTATNRNMSLSANGGTQGRGGSIELISGSNLLIDANENATSFALSVLGSGPSNGGTIKINAAGNVTYNGGIKLESINVLENEFLIRSSGSIDMIAGGKLALVSDLKIFDNGNNGRIRMVGSTVFINPEVKILATGSSGSRSISIEATTLSPSAIFLSTGSIVSTSALGPTGAQFGGKIELKSAGGIVAASSSKISADGKSNGGQISIEVASSILAVPEIQAIATNGTGGTISIIGSSAANGLTVDLAHSLLTAGGKINFASEGAIDVQSTGTTVSLDGAVSAGGRLDNNLQVVDFAMSTKIVTKGQKITVEDIHANENVNLTSAEITVSNTVTSKTGNVELIAAKIQNNGFVIGKAIDLSDGNNDMSVIGGPLTGIFDTGLKGSINANSTKNISLSGNIKLLGDWIVLGTELNVAGNSKISVEAGTQTGSGNGNLEIENTAIRLSSSLHVAKQFSWTNPTRDLSLDRTISAGSGIIGDTIKVHGHALEITQIIDGGNAALISTTKTTVEANTITMKDVSSIDGLEAFAMRSSGDILLRTAAISSPSNRTALFLAKNISVIDSSPVTILAHVRISADGGNINIQNTAGGNILVGSSKLEALGNNTAGGKIYLTSGSVDPTSFVPPLTVADNRGVFYTSPVYPGETSLNIVMNEKYMGGGLILNGAPSTIFFSSILLPEFTTEVIFEGISIPPLTEENSKKDETVMIAREDNQFIPVSHTEAVEVRPGKSKDLTISNAQSSSCRYFGENTKASYRSENCIEMTQGEILVSAQRKLLIVCGQNKVEMDAGTICLISMQHGQTEALVLHDSSKNSVCVLGNESRLVVHCGQRAVTSQGKHKYVGGVAERNKRTLPFGPEQTIHISEFSLSSLAEHSDLVWRTLRGNSLEERSLSKKCLKSAACLALVKAAHGFYSSGNQSAGF